MGNKEGEITAFYLVAVIISVVGFVIVLMLLYSLEFESFSEDEICKLSVLTRASLKEGVQGYAPLKCTTKKVCITDSIIGGKCKQFAGEKGVTTARLGGSDEDKARKIEQLSADAMLTCWKQMGEGKLDLFAEPVKFNLLEGAGDFIKLKGAKTSCVICSRVALADYVLANEKLLGLVDVNDYMEKTQVPGSSLTYLQTFTDRQVRGFSGEFRQEFGKTENQKEGSDEIAVVFMQIKTDGDPLSAFGEGALGATGFVFGSSYALGVVGKIANWPGIVLSGVAAAGTGGLRAYGTYRDQQISAGRCGAFSKETEGEADRQGCSVVAPIDYDVGVVNEMCYKIEGSP